MLLYITASEGGYEYIHCPNEFTYKIQNTTCYLNPYCPDEYIYITSTLVSNKEYHSCKETDHQFEEWSSSPSDELLVYWRESEGVYIILKVSSGTVFWWGGGGGGNSSTIVFLVATTN